MELQESGRVDRRRAPGVQTAPRGAAEARTRAMAFRARRERRDPADRSQSLAAQPGWLSNAARGQDRYESERAFRDFGSSSVDMDRPESNPT